MSTPWQKRKRKGERDREKCNQVPRVLLNVEEVPSPTLHRLFERLVVIRETGRRGRQTRVTSRVAGKNWGGGEKGGFARKGGSGGGA